MTNGDAPDECRSRTSDFRKFGPMPADHPAIGQPCPACEVPIVEGDIATLVLLGPGSSEEARERAREGRPYNGVAALVHWACATGEEP